MPRKYKHLFVPLSDSTDYTRPRSGWGGGGIPPRDPDFHGRYIKRRFEQAWEEAMSEHAVYHAERHGVYLEFKSDPGARLVTKGLEDLRSKKIRLLNVRSVTEDGETVTYATVYVAHDKKRVFLDKFSSYISDTTEKGKPCNADLVNSIADLRKALLVESFWQDERQLIPGQRREWCEVWLSSDQAEVVSRFEELLRQADIPTKDGDVRFPERTVKLIYANRRDLEKITAQSDDVAEYRSAKETAAFWLQSQNREQADWVIDLLDRLQIRYSTDVAVCVLDTGVNNGHPLLSPILEDSACMTVNPTWRTHDHQGHGTSMAGIAAYGDLRACLLELSPIVLTHILESVKILPLSGSTPKELWGHITTQAAALAEIQEPLRKRVFCLAVSATDTRDRGRPSSWSGQLDQLSAGMSDGFQRLFVVCAGNLTDITNEVLNYPSAQVTDSIHDPGQAWNCLTVGAYTDLDEIADQSFEHYAPVAAASELSPFTTTSAIWEDKWPIKPEVVLEGGNVAHDGNGNWDIPDEFSLLTTHHNPIVHHFGRHLMTSAATAYASWLAAKIMADYPDLWPETVRALIVHSAEWTEGLKRQFLPNESKAAYSRLLRVCGYGVPDLDRALHSMNNSLTLIAQQSIQPYIRKPDGRYVTNKMHFYDLPWPRQALLDLPFDTVVKMRVTLSYFIEPGPGEIGWKDRYRYASHGLRFEINSPGEDRDSFIQRINASARADEEGTPATNSAADHWVIGSKGRDKGSIHSDIWKGTAAELAASNLIAIYPIVGWWRERTHLRRAESSARYSLLVSISTPEENVDIYTPVAIQLGVPVPVPVEL